MLRALLESGVEPDMVVGSSVGSINGAYFAGDPTFDGIAKLERLWCGLKRRDIFPWTWRRLFGFIRGRGHLVTSDGLRRLLDNHLPYRDLKDAAVPVHIVASDVLSGKAVVLSRGPVTQAILASTAIPAAFAPVEIDGRLLCDGAVASNTPVTAAISLGARRLIVLPTGFACAPERPPSGAIASALHAITLLTAGQLVAELERIRQPTRYHILPTACPLGVSPFDFAERRSSSIRPTGGHWAGFQRAVSTATSSRMRCARTRIPRQRRLDPSSLGRRGAVPDDRHPYLPSTDQPLLLRSNLPFELRPHVCW